MISLDLHILDIVHNSISAKATLINISIIENPALDQYLIEITDNGKGISPDKLSTITDPYTTTRKTRKVGLGLPLFRQNAEQTGGSLEITSEVNIGTKLKVLFKHNHIDRPAIGDIAGVLVNLVAGFGKIRFIYTHSTPHGTYSFDTKTINETLEGVKLNNPEIRNFLKEMINENLDEIKITR
jgi:hypothetical protein